MLFIFGFIFSSEDIIVPEFNQQDLSSSLSLKPKIGYSFTNYITGDIYFNYIVNENKTTGKRTERDFGFNMRIKIKG